jgi:peptidoglycan pentaglycine glycine transferase (the first glycine)
MLSIKLIQNPKEWDAFVKMQEFSAFVQSPTYGEFYKSRGEDYFIVGLYDTGMLIGGSLVLTTHAKRGNFLYLPYGPILNYTDTHQIEAFFEYLKNYAEKAKYDFIRVSPLVDESEDVSKALKAYGLLPAPMHVLAETSWILDLEKPEAELLKDMKKNHRNLIRRCEREGVRVERRTDDTALEELNTLLDTTVKKHNFVRFSRTYINTEFQAFNDTHETVIMHAYLPSGALDASAIMMFYGNMAVYRHSASLGLDKKLPSSYAIQWETIKEAKKRGCRWYNFWGIAPVGAKKKHPFYGITHFKKGFGGFQKDLLHCHDLPVSKKYWFNWIIETMRKHKRGF